MITDSELYTLAIFLGSLSMLLIILYHFLEVNAIDSDAKIIALAEHQKAGVKAGVQGKGAVGP
jgi:hypothetical protein